ncbi:hypothetical protein ACFX15_035255 [Malus domestica]
MASKLTDPTVKFDPATTKLIDPDSLSLKLCKQTVPDSPCLFELIHHFLQDYESSAAVFLDNESDSDQVDSASDADQTKMVELLMIWGNWMKLFFSTLMDSHRTITTLQLIMFIIKTNDILIKITRHLE